MQAKRLVTSTGFYSQVRSLMIATWTVAWRDLRVELRGRELLPALAQFVILALVVANFAFDLGGQRSLQVGPGVLWLVLIFAGLLTFSRTFVGDKERGSLEVMLLTGTNTAVILLGKSLAAGLGLLLAALFLLPAMTVLLGMPISVGTAVIVLLAVIGMAVLGCLFAALAARTRAPDLLLPILALPFWIPYVVLGVGLVRASLGGLLLLPPLFGLVYLDLLVILVAVVAAPWVLDD
ncbi:MAG: heme exporter protein CcmB [Candidatus Dormibacteraceae bacterium]